MARDFPGTTNDYLAVGDVTAIDITGTDITVACWAQFDAVALEQGLVTKWGNTAATRQYTLELLNSKIDFAVSDGAAVTTCTGTTPLAAGPWYHLCGKQTATDVFAYVNGVQDGTAVTERSIPNTTAPLQFGKYVNDGLPLDGRLAEVAIWAFPLSDSEITQLAGGASPLTIQADSLRGYWPICGMDSSERDHKNGNTATINGTLPLAGHIPGRSPCDSLLAPMRTVNYTY